MKDNFQSYHFSNISQLMGHLGESPPAHPLIGLVDNSKPWIEVFEKGAKITLDFYKISFKKNFKGKVRYGQAYYDFQEGGLAFLKPRQVVVYSEIPESYEGYVLYFHPDLIRGYNLGSLINRYGYFSYNVSEALFLSAEEKEVVGDLFLTISRELENRIDAFSQDVLVSQIELLLNYSNRFYNRQFITRKAVNHEIITALDHVLQDYFLHDEGLRKGFPSVRYFSKKLNLSTRYLSDMLRSLTGQNTQQYIQNKLIEQSKDLLSSTDLSVAEIAYKLGFEYPQSFSKLFKIKTNLSPLKFRQRFN